MSEHCSDSSLELEPWQVKSHRLLVDKSPWLKVWEEEVVLPNGITIPDYITEERREYASVLALTADQRVPLVAQYKHGLQDVVWGCPAGYLDRPDEDPLQCVRRELAEETGFVAEEWHLLAAPVLNSNRGPARCYLYLALGAKHNGRQHLDDTEAIHYALYSLEEVRRMTLAGRLPNISGVANVFAGLDRLRELGVEV